VVSGIALALLAVSRPYEGIVFAAGMFVAVPSRYWIRVLAVAIPALLPLAIYNHAITGSPFTLPYSLYEEQYDPVPNFLWETPRAIHTWPNAEMTFQYQKVYASYYRREMAPGGLADAIAKKFEVIRTTLYGGRTWLPSAWGVLLLPLVALPRALRRRSEARALFLARVNVGRAYRGEAYVFASTGRPAEAARALEAAEHELEYTRVKAPFPGVVVKRYRNLGDFAPAGGGRCGPAIHGPCAA